MLWLPGEYLKYNDDSALPTTQPDHPVVANDDDVIVKRYDVIIDEAVRKV